MKINTNNNINFGSQKLFRAQLVRENILGEKTPLRAYISLLEKSDLKRLDLQDENWLDEHGYRGIGNDIIWDLKKKKDTPYWNKFYFLAVECPDEPKGQKIKAIAEVAKCDKNIKLLLLHSQSSLEDIGKKTYGAGSCLIYALTKMAQKMDKDKINVTSLDTHSTRFYKKMGFERYVGDIYIMSGNKIPETQKVLEGEYNISPVNFKKHPFI